MIEQWENISRNIEAKFADPDFYRNAPGTPLPELLKELEELFQKDSGLPRHIAKARAFSLVCEKIQLKVSNGDCFPSFASCLTRPLITTYITPWRRDIFDRFFTEEERQEIRAASDSRTIRVGCDFEHSVPDWDAVLELGLSGLLERVKFYQQQNSGKFAEHPEYVIFYDAVIMEYNAALSLVDRLISEVEKLPPHPLRELQYSALKQLRYGKATTFYEALLQIWLYFQLSEYIDVIQTRSLGNLDRILYPYCKKDIDSGNYTEKDIRFFIRCFMYQITSMHYTIGHPFYFGGTNADGSSAINELSYWILEEHNAMNILDPKLHIKVSENTPQDFIDYALNMIRSGRNSIVFVGEPCIIRTMTKYGYSLREAQTADVKGCYEYCVRGGCVETAPLTLNAVKILGLTLHNGIEVLSGQRQGPETGNVAEFTSFRQLYRAFLHQLFYQLDRNLKYALRLEEHLDECTPAPLISGTFESSLRRAVDGYARGAKYNNTNVWICGSATTADSLTMIKRYCFDRKKFTLPALVEMLDRDFEGDELIRQQLLNDPEKYGNNQTLPDRIAVHFASAAAKRINGKPNSRGGIITTSLHASNRFFEWADFCEATADGRKRGDELSKNMSATQGNAICGATSLVSSVLKFDSSLFMADLPVDIMLHPSEVKGDAGLAAMRSLLMTYIKNYGHAMHFNVMDAAVLRAAQKEPEKYRDLQVRICGWNVYWNSISKREQDAYIRQAEKL